MMNTLKLFAAPLALAVATLAMAGTLHAQPMQQRHDMRGHNDQRGWNMTPARSAAIRQDVNRLANQIDRAAQRRTISAREATGLRRQARSVQQLYMTYQRGGLTPAEVSSLQNRVNQIRVGLRMERLDWDNRRG